MTLERQVESGERNLVDSHQQLVGRRGREDFIKQNLERRVGNRLETQGRLAHLADTRANGFDVFRAQVRVVREAGFELVDRLGA